MKVEQVTWSEQSGWQAPAAIADAQLVLVFGDRSAFEQPHFADAVATQWPNAMRVGCSTAGQILGTEVFDEGAVATAVQFDHTDVRMATTPVSASQSAAAGAALAQQLAAPNLAHVLIISEGLDINGEALVRGIGEKLPPTVSVTGGLSADGEHFKQTRVLADRVAEGSSVAAIGLYGSRLKVGCGSLGGWDPFGPERQITRSKGNVLYELDGQSALAFYKRYLGDHAADLPASGLLFPLSLRTREVSAPVVRTILSVSEADQSLTFAGDVPTGGYVRLMKANFDRLIDGAVGAGRVSAGALSAPVDLALLISCVGRRMVLRQRVEEEVEGVRDIVGPGRGHHRLLFLRGDLAVHAEGALRAAQPDHDRDHLFRTVTMAELHSLLRRQLKRHFPDDRVPPELAPILTAIDQAYHQFDDDRSMLERSLDLSSQELLQANSELRALVSAFPDHILRLDPRGSILDVKGAISEQSRRWKLGLDFLETVDDEVRPLLRDALQRVVSEHAAMSIELESGAEIAVPRSYEARLLPLADAQVAGDPPRCNRAAAGRTSAARQPARAARGASRSRTPRRRTHRRPRPRQRRIAARDGGAAGRRIGAQPARGAAAPCAEDGGDRTAVGRHRARLQQPPDRDQRLFRAAAEGLDGSPLRGRRRRDPQRRRSRGNADAAAAGVQPTADPLAGERRAQPARHST